MSLDTYTVSATDRIRIRHDAEARFTVAAGKTVLEDRLVDPTTLGGAMTVASIMYNRASYSGGVSWWNPSTGQPLSSRPTVQVRFRPQDVLTGDELCGCPVCVS